jgi:hypothetical protein
MSFKSDNFQRIKDFVIEVDKYADFSVNFNDNTMVVYTKSIEKEREILHAFRVNNVVYKTEHTKELNRFKIKL